MAIVKYAMGSEHAIFLYDNGTVYGVGRNNVGQLGDGTTTDRTELVKANIDDVVDIAVGAEHTMALKGDGSVWAWGSNSKKQRGFGMYFARDDYDPPPSPGNNPSPMYYGVVHPDTGNGIAEGRPLTGIAGIACGYYSSYAVGIDGEFWMTGEIGIKYGRLDENPSIGTHEDFRRLSDQGAYGLSQTPLTLPANIVDISAGATQIMFLTGDGQVYVAAKNAQGEAGQGDQGTVYAEPTLISGLTASHISAGRNHCMAVKTDGTVAVWGDGGYGKMGGGNTLSILTPFTVPDLSDIVEVAAGWDHSFAVAQDGTIWAWGRGHAYQLGTGKAQDEYSPVEVGMLGEAKEFNLCPVPEDDEEIPEERYDPGIPDPCEGPSGPPHAATAPSAPGAVPNPTMSMPKPNDFEMPGNPLGMNPNYMPTAPIQAAIGDVPVLDGLIDDIELPEMPKMPCLDPTHGMPGHSCPGAPGGGGGSKPPGGGGPGSGWKPPTWKPPGDINIGIKPPYRSDDTFADKRCYTDKLVVDAIRELCQEIGLNPNQMILDTSCTKLFTRCFDKGSRKWDAIWWLSDLCGYGVFDPGDGNPIEIEPTTPLPDTWIYHEYIDLLEFTRNYDALDVYYAVEVYRPQATRGGRVTIPEYKAFVIVDTPFNVSDQKVQRIEADPSWSDQQCLDKANAEAAKMVGGLNITAAIPLNLKIRYRHQLIIMRPSLGFSQRFLVRKRELSLNENGHLTLIEARFLGNISVIHAKGVPSNAANWPAYIDGVAPPGAPYEERKRPAGFVKAHSHVRIPVRGVRPVEGRGGSLEVTAGASSAGVYSSVSNVQPASHVTAHSQIAAALSGVPAPPGSSGGMVTAV